MLGSGRAGSLATLAATLAAGARESTRSQLPRSARCAVLRCAAGRGRARGQVCGGSGGREQQDGGQRGGRQRGPAGAHPLRRAVRAPRTVLWVPSLQFVFPVQFGLLRSRKFMEKSCSAVGRRCMVGGAGWPESLPGIPRAGLDALDFLPRLGRFTEEQRCRDGGLSEAAAERTQHGGRAGPRQRVRSPPLARPPTPLPLPCLGPCPAGSRRMWRSP